VSIASVEAALRAAVLRAPTGGRIVIGYSGGLDSSVLLHAAARFVEDGRRVLALHVNHGLSPQADVWQRHCESVSAALGVCFAAHRVDVAAGSSLEASARRARYGAFRAVLGSDDVLWLGHHLDDQAETVLWRLMRGGGSAALAAMPAARPLGRGRLSRPLLEVTRVDIARWAQAHGLDWIDDESNTDLRFERNFIRHDVMPTLRRRWPDVAERLGAAARRFGAEAALLQQTLDAQLEAAGAETDRVPLTIATDPQALLLLRRWLARADVHGVRERALVEIIRQARSASDRTPSVAVADGVDVRRYADRLFVVEQRASTFAPTPWQFDAALELPCGRLDARRTNRQGLRGALTRVEVRPRRGGERLRPAGRDGSRTVKRLLQEARVPPWLRAAYPLIYVDDRLAAVPGIAVDADFADASGNAWELTWDAPRLSVAN
jgi:tRNA(Ile)-lysidine synthase